MLIVATMSDNTNREILIAGAAAAFTIDLLVYPLDTIKTRLQSQDFVKTYASTAGVKQAPATLFRGLYQGVGSVIIATLPASGVFFTTYEATKQLYTNILPSSLPQPFVHSAASGTAELASCLVLTPAEVIKSNAQMARRSGTAKGGSTSLEAWRMLRQSEGGALRRLWSGYTALAARNLPFTAMQFPMFEYLRGKLWASRSTGSVLLETGLVNGLSAGLSGSVAAVITTPSDVVKTRMMLVQKRDSGAGGLEVAKQVFRERGVKGLFRGGALRAVWTFVGSGLYLGTYEVCKVWLRGDKEVGEDDDL
ncbi:mitochondrial carrier [Coniochaeta ligniaria NRRL 30616]|uniref:Mitochondrial carrier n=1 Tax=Coniochaeta ligniaria NRRL 30616 TaxID=1408157 RepID=A0A1J7JPK7_9PEZI|nr:mitochondrial carrier [Coniochaeta ligniaria NRRL 30616]